METVITYQRVEEEYKNEDDSPDFNGTKVYFNTSNDSIQKTCIQKKKKKKKNARYQGLKGRIKKIRLMESKIKVTLILEETKATR